MWWCGRDIGMLSLPGAVSRPRSLAFLFLGRVGLSPGDLFGILFPVGLRNGGV